MKTQKILYGQLQIGDLLFVQGLLFRITDIKSRNFKEDGKEFKVISCKSYAVSWYLPNKQSLDLIGYGYAENMGQAADWVGATIIDRETLSNYNVSEAEENILLKK